MTTTYPWVCFVIIGKNVSAKHFTTRARARLYAEGKKQDSRVSVKIRRANRNNAKKWYAMVSHSFALSSLLPSPATKKAVSVQKPSAKRSRSPKVETLSFAFMG